MKFLTITLFLFSISTIFAQKTEKKVSPNPPRKIVSSIVIGADNMGDFYGIGFNVVAQYRLLNNRLLAGIGLEPFFSLNSISVPGKEKAFFSGEVKDIDIATNLHLVPYHLNFHYYILHPNHNRFTARIDARGGPVVQVVQTESIFPNTLVEGPSSFDPFRFGYFYGGGVTFEYFLRYLSLTLDVGASYQHINKKITFIDKQNQIRTSVKIGVAVSFGPKSKY